MRPSLGEVSVALYGAWRLMRFDPNGLRYFITTTDAFWKSFYAAVLCLPGTMITIQASSGGLSSVHGLVSHAMAYVVGWVALPVVLHGVCEVIGKQSSFKRCVIAINWSLVLQTYIFMPFSVMSSYEEAPGIWAFSSLAALLFVLIYEGYIFRRSLEITALAAAGLVAADVTLSLLLSSVVATP